MVGAMTEDGEIDIAVPRDRAGSFEPLLIAKGQTRFDGFDDKILSLYARGMTVREIKGHLSELYGAEVSPDLISRVTDAVLDEVWSDRSGQSAHAPGSVRKSCSRSCWIPRIPRRHSVMASSSKRRATKRRRSSMTELSFHGIDTSCLPEQTKSVTHVSGTKCHLCIGPITHISSNVVG